MADLARERPSRAAERVRTEEGLVSEYLAFRVAGATFAVPVAIVREIVRSSQITPVPRAPHSVLGITSFRGRIVTVVDLEARLSHVAARPRSQVTKRQRILMVELAGEAMGLVVDEVLVVYRLTPKDIERASTAVGSDVADHVVGLARPEPDLVIQLLDAKALAP